MIEIKIDGNPLVLNKKAKIRLLFNNPYLNNDSFEMSYSFGIDMPACKENYLLLGFVNFIEVKKDVRSFPCELWHKGAFLEKGHFKLLGYDDKTIRANVEFKTAIHNIPTEKSIRDLNYGGPINLGNTADDVVSHANGIIQAVWPEVKYTFPTIYNPKFYDGKNVEYGNVINRYDGNLNTFIANTLSTGNVNTLSPQVFFNTVLQAIFEDMGYKVVGDYINSAAHQKIWIYGNRALDFQTGSFIAITFLYAARTALVLYNASNVADHCQADNIWDDPDTYSDEADNLHLIVFNDDTSTPLSDDGNNYDTGTGEYTIPQDGKYIISLALKLSLDSPGNAPVSSDRSIAVYVYVYVDGDWIDMHVETFNETVYSAGNVEINYSTAYLDRVAGQKVSIKLRAVWKDKSIRCVYDTWRSGCLHRFCNITLLSQSTFKFYKDDTSSVNSYQKTLNIGEHLPDWKCSDFIREFWAFWKLYFDFNEANKTVSINFLKDYFDQVDEEDYTERASPEYSSKIDKRKSFGHKFELPSDDANSVGKERLPEYYQNYDNASEKITFKMTPLFWCTTGGATAGSSGFTGCPWIESVGNSSMFGLGLSNNLSSLRLAFYYGIKTTTDGFNYPMANAFYFDVNGTRISDLSLQLNTLLGIIETNHKRINDFFINTEEIEREILFNIVDINRFSFVTRKRIKNALHLLKSADITIGENIEPGNCTLLKF